jgi:hypothetical protein
MAKELPDETVERLLQFAEDFGSLKDELIELRAKIADGMPAAEAREMLRKIEARLDAGAAKEAGDGSNRGADDRKEERSEPRPTVERDSFRYPWQLF